MIKQFRKEYSWLSNFAEVDIEYDGRIFPSVEHAYLSCKSHNEDWKDLCMDIVFSAGDLKKVSKDLELVANWETEKVRLMNEFLIIKFNQEPFKRKLLFTKDEYIQEGNWWNDKFWGVCLKTSHGENRLGQMIMDIRKELQNG